MKIESARGDAYKAVQHVYRNSPGRSWTLLNGALSGTLMAAIEAHLSFLPDDFAAMCSDFNGGRWMGDGGGSHLGERFYVQAVRVGHTSACISFEKWAGRPAALWSEQVKTPERLHDGSDFTWEGTRVCVTSMMSGRLIACTYKREESSGRDSLKEGNLDYVDGHYREVEYLKRQDDKLLIRFGPPVPHETRTVARRFTITYETLSAKRRALDTARKDALKEITLAETTEALSAVAERLSSASGAYRHFDIEDFRKAIENRRGEFSERQNDAQRKIDDEKYRVHQAESLERWAAGEDIRGYWSVVRLRVKGKYVQTSTGQNATLESVRLILPMALRNRRKRGQVITGKVDMHDIHAFTDAGVQVGCTLIPWPELERLAKALRAKAA